MGQGSIIGYDLSEEGCQISYYNEAQHEPETVKNESGEYQIPLVIGCKNDAWYIGEEARSHAKHKDGAMATDLLAKSMRGAKIHLGRRTYDAVWLLAKFIRLTLQQFDKIESIVFCVPEMSSDIARMLRGIGQRMGIERKKIHVQDYKESYCYFMFYQPKELWQYESALFYCDKRQIKAYMLSQIAAGAKLKKQTFVTVDEVASAQMEELKAVYPVLNVEQAKMADFRFQKFIESVFEKKIVSSVFLMGEGFENNWYPNSLKVLCNGRRAFLGNNLYSKGACYTAYQRGQEELMKEQEGPVYLDESKLKDQISIQLRQHGKEEWYPLVPWGRHWYEGDGQWEVLLEDTDDIEIKVESLLTGTSRIERVQVNELPKRAKYTIRLQVEVLFVEENVCKILFKDVGFGEFFPATDFVKEHTIYLGGRNEQFDTM